MNKLQEINLSVYEAFNNVEHTIRQSDRFWAGLSADIVIEQQYMRGLKTSEGLTRGRRVTESERSIWILSRPTCLAINLQMQHLSRVEYSSSEQHMEMGILRQKRDKQDVLSVYKYFKDKSPFDGDGQLRNISNGVVAIPSQC